MSVKSRLGKIEAKLGEKNKRLVILHSYSKEKAREKLEELKKTHKNEDITAMTIISPVSKEEWKRESDVVVW